MWSCYQAGMSEGFQEPPVRQIVRMQKAGDELDLMGCDVRAKLVVTSSSCFPDAVPSRYLATALSRPTLGDSSSPTANEPEMGIGCKQC